MADTYSVERSIHIDAPPSVVFARIVDFRQWTSWSPYEGLDDDLERTYEGAGAGVGTAYAWSGNMKAGTGRMETVDVEEARRVVIQQRFLKPFRSTSTSTFTLDPVPAAAISGGPDERAVGTELTWSLVGAANIMSKTMGVFSSMDRVLGPTFEKGLADLKAEVEADQRLTPPPHRGGGGPGRGGSSGRTSRP